MTFPAREQEAAHSLGMYGLTCKVTSSDDKGMTGNPNIYGLTCKVTSSDERGMEGGGGYPNIYGLTCKVISSDDRGMGGRYPHVRRPREGR